MGQPYQAKYIQAGAAFDHTPGAAVAAGDVVVQTSLTGIAHAAIAANTLGSLNAAGIYDVVKANEQQNAGAVLYWDADGDPYGGEAGTGCATTTPTDNTFLGFAIAVAEATDEVVRALVIPVTGVNNTVHNALTAVLADPGNAGAIPVTDTGHCPIVTAGAETRTLADPTYTGQMLLLMMKTDQGDCEITAASAVNQAGNDTITLDDEGDTVLLVAIESGADKVWRVVVNDGATIATA